MARSKPSLPPPQHVLSAGAIIVRKTADGYVYLLLRAYKNWDFPKGLVEPGEDPLQGALREVEEETSLTDLSFPCGHVYRETGPYGRMSKIARYYLAETQTEHITLPVSPELGHPEHEEYRWLSYAQARQLVQPRLHPVIDWAQYSLPPHPAPASPA